jgi:hypothetical protein
MRDIPHENQDSPLFIHVERAYEIFIQATKQTNVADSNYIAHNLTATELISMVTYIMVSSHHGMAK